MVRTSMALNTKLWSFSSACGRKTALNPVQRCEEQESACSSSASHINSTTPELNSQSSI